MKSMTWLILALGNPGDEYAKTYHNVGLLALPTIVEILVKTPIDDLDWKTYQQLFTYHATANLIVAYPGTFMNESGRAAAEAIKKFKITPDHLIVVHDDSDIALGDFKVQFDRSSGGHKGAQSIIDHLKTQAFWRVRIGIRPTETKNARKKAGEFVLAKIPATSMKKLNIAFLQASEEMQIKIFKDVKI